MNTINTQTMPAWSPVPQYVPPNLSQIKPGEPVPPAFRGGMDDIDPPSDGNAEPTTRPVESTDFSGDIPLSLAVSAFGGVSMSPERRGASSKSEYGQSMAADYETLRAQAVKGGTLDLLPEVFARYRARQASAYRAYLSSSSRCVSSFIAGPANFPVARMQKRNDIAHKRLNEYLDGGKMALQSAIRTLRPDLRAIMSGDADAIDRLTIEIEAAERLQSRMKACNKAIRATAKMDEAHKVAALMEIGYNETQAVEILNPPAHYGRGPGFPSFRLTNNQANIRRMRARLEQITAAKARPVESVECANGVTLEDDAPANRVRLFFPGKPSEAIRDELKASGFRWAPSVGAWQAYRNYGTLATARRMAGEPLPAAPEVAEVEQVEQVEQVEATPTVAVSTEAPTPAPVEFLEALADADRAWKDGKESAQAMEKFPRGAMGLILDSAKATPEYLTAKQREDYSIARIKAANTYLIKNFKAEYLAYRAAQRATKMAPTPPAVESQPEAAAPAVETAQDVTSDNVSGWGPAIGERYIGAVEYAVQEANRRGDGFEYRTGENALMERRKLPAVAQVSECTPYQTVKSKSEKWAALLFMDAGLFAMVFNMPNKPGRTQRFNTASERMAALQTMARAADAPTDTPPGGGLPHPTESAPSTPTATVAAFTPDTTVAVSGDFDPVECDELAMEASAKAMRKASESSAKEKQAADHAKALIDLPAQYPQLKRAESRYADGKLAAVNARILLKASFKGVKFSVTSDYNSLRIEWLDGPTDSQVNEVVGRFDIGASDSMTDYFYTVSTAFSKLFGGVQYMTTKRNTSDALIQQAIDKLYAKREEKPTVQDYRKCAGVFDWNGQNYENRRMRETLETISYA